MPTVAARSKGRVRIVPLDREFAVWDENSPSAVEHYADLGLTPDGPWVDAKSIVKVMATRAPKDSTIYFRAEGNDAKAALEALVTLVDGDFQDGP